MPDGGSPRVVSLDGDVGLIVADVPASIYAPASIEPRLGDLDWVSAAGAAHHGVVDALAEAGITVLPFRLFTLFSTEQKAVATLRDSRGALAHAFDRVRGKQEWVLRIGVPDPSRMSAEREPLSARDSGTNFLQTKADARRQAASRAARVREYATAVFAALEQLAEASKTRPVESGGTLILDAAFLVSASQVEAMHAALTQRAEQLLKDGCPVSLTGPWPPYSFASMETNGA
jgi:hypothetical protein